MPPTVMVCCVLALGRVIDFPQPGELTPPSDAPQSDYIIKGLNLFRNMGLKGCWIVYWNDADNDYGIRGRLAEQKVGEWIAQNS